MLKEKLSDSSLASAEHFFHAALECFLLCDHFDVLFRVEAFLETLDVWRFVGEVFFEFADGPDSEFESSSDGSSGCLLFEKDVEAFLLALVETNCLFEGDDG